MASINKVILIGNLGADPETRYTPGGDAVTNIRVATTDRWKDKATGETKEATEWHRVSFWGRLAEVAGEYLKKGSQVYVEGSLKTRKWRDKDGQDRYSTEIRGDVMQMLGNRQDGAGDRTPGRDYGDVKGRAEPRREPETAGAGAPATRPAGKFDDMEDDIPFASCALEDDVIFRRFRWPLE